MKFRFQQEEICDQRSLSLASGNTNLPVRGLGIGQRLTSQPEVAFLKSKAGQELWPLCLELVEVALFDCDR